MLLSSPSGVKAFLRDLDPQESPFAHGIRNPHSTHFQPDHSSNIQDIRRAAKCENIKSLTVVGKLRRTQRTASTKKNKQTTMPSSSASYLELLEKSQMDELRTSHTPGPLSIAIFFLGFILINQSIRMLFSSEEPADQDESGVNISNGASSSRGLEPKMMAAQEEEEEEEEEEEVPSHPHRSSKSRCRSGPNHLRKKNSKKITSEAAAQVVRKSTKPAAQFSSSTNPPA